MSRKIRIALAILGLVLIGFAGAGLYHSALDSRLQLLIAIGAAGLVLLPMGLRRVR